MHGGPQGGQGQQQGGSQGCCGERGGCRRDEDEEPDHLEHTAELWEKAFWQALHEVRVELMKEKIKAAWGENMKATADGVLEAFHAEWKEFQAKQADKAKEEGALGAIKDKLKEGLKKGPQ